MNIIVHFNGFWLSTLNWLILYFQNEDMEGAQGDPVRLKFLDYVKTEALGMSEPDYQVFKRECFLLVNKIDRVPKVVYRPAT